MGKLSSDLDAFRKAQNLKTDKIDEEYNKALNNLVEEIAKVEDEVEHYRSEVRTGDFADFNGDPLQFYKGINK
jgi:phage host-nuclease inhibitor protein Gam